MKLTLFGATGRTGIPFIQQALEAGHEVTAFVRNPSRLTMQHARLKVVQGDVFDAVKVEQAISGADAVVSVLGHAKDTPRNLMAVAAQNIVIAMKKHGVRRIVTLTGAGVRDENDQPKLVDNIIRFLLTVLSPAVLKDSEDHVRIIRESGLDWVVVRGPMLTEGPRQSKYRVGMVGKGSGTRIARADVADFMLKQVTDKTYLRAMPMVSD